jgi:hypothetical protein
VPTSSDDVVIATGHTVTLDTNAIILSLTVNGTLTFGNSANRTLSVLGNVTIASGGILNVGNTGNGAHTLNIGGSLSNAGSLAARNNPNRYFNTVFNGAGVQTMSGNGTTAFNDLTVNAGSRVVFPATAVPTVEGNMVVSTGGAVQQTLTVNSGTVPFLQISSASAAVKYRGVELTPTASALGSTTVVITTTVNGGCTTTGVGSPAYATRCFNITPTNNVAATVRLYALTTSQLNGIAQANLRVWHYTGGAWQQLATPTTGTDGGAYSYGQGTTTGSSPFLLGGTTAPTAVTLTAFDAQPQTVTWLLPIGLILTAGALVLVIKRRA